MKILSSSILSANFSILGEEVSAVEAAGADSIHVDVMNGSFVPNISFGPLVVNAICKSTSLPVDVHLMIDSPELHIMEFISAGATFISVHQEACRHLHRTIQFIRNKGIKAGIALNPSTPLSQIRLMLEHVDFILIMSVNPGFAGQEFIDIALQKVSELRRIIEGMGLNILIEVDGGVNTSTIGKTSSAGADIFVVGSAIFNSEDYTKTITNLKSKF